MPAIVHPPGTIRRYGDGGGGSFEKPFSACGNAISPGHVVLLSVVGVFHKALRPRMTIEIGDGLAGTFLNITHYGRVVSMKEASRYVLCDDVPSRRR